MKTQQIKNSASDQQTERTNEETSDRERGLIYLKREKKSKQQKRKKVAKRL